jgi:fused signal recognition particle receptor
MLNIFKRRKQTQQTQQTQQPGLFRRLTQGLVKTSSAMGAGIANLLLGKKQIDEALLEEIETHLLMADVGVTTTQQIIGQLMEQISRKALTDGELVLQQLQQQLFDMIAPQERHLIIDETKKPFVMLMVGVNGVGKTTTIGKLAKQLQAQGKQVMLAAGDTFRAAAMEQLQVWGERNNVPVIAQHAGADSASVIFDALQAAKTRGVDVLIADTAGRLHTQTNLMAELAKVVRVMRKLDPSAPHEVMLVLDAGNGQNALTQAQQFKEAVEVTGITLTKLDGTAKGGIIFPLSSQLQIPLRFIGIGEGIDDLQPFVAQDFIEALFARETAQQSV